MNSITELQEYRNYTSVCVKGVLFFDGAITHDVCMSRHVDTLGHAVMDFPEMPLLKEKL